MVRFSMPEKTTMGVGQWVMMRAGDLHAVHPRQHQVHRHHVRAQALAQLEGALAISCLAHHGEGGSSAKASARRRRTITESSTMRTRSADTHYPPCTGPLGGATASWKPCQDAGRCTPGHPRPASAACPSGDRPARRRLSPASSTPSSRSTRFLRRPKSDSHSRPVAPWPHREGPRIREGAAQPEPLGGGAQLVGAQGKSLVRAGRVKRPILGRPA